MKLSKIKKSYWMIIVLVIIGGGYYWYHSTHPALTQVQYRTASAEKGTITTSISASGNVIVDQSATVDPTITGTVANLAVNVGDNVKKSQTLFTIVNDDLSVSNDKAAVSLQQSKNSLDSAELQVKQAKADYKAAKKDDTTTSDQKKILKEKIEIAEQGVVAAQKSYTATIADYNNQLATAAKRNVISPIDGTVNAVNIKNGDDLSRISGGNNGVAPIIIGDLGTLKAQVQVNEVDVSSVSIGQKVMLTFNAIDGLSISGKVEKMDSLGTVTSGVVTYNVTIDFDSLDPKLRPEMSVSAAIITGVKQDIIIVPNGAVKSQNGSSYIQILNSGQTTPTQVMVQTGISNNTNTEIISGVNVGDSVVTQTITSGTGTTAATSSTTRTGGNTGGFRLPGLGGGGRPD
jgi:RND family efflux transporter MFP subunit